MLIDLRRGKVIVVRDGKGDDALKPSWARLKRSSARIRAVSTDMSAAYIGAALEHLPEAAMVRRSIRRADDSFELRETLTAYGKTTALELNNTFLWDQ